MGVAEYFPKGVALASVGLWLISLGLVIIALLTASRTKDLPPNDTECLNSFDWNEMNKLL